MVCKYECVKPGESGESEGVFFDNYKDAWAYAMTYNMQVLEHQYRLVDSELVADFSAGEEE